MPAGFVEATMNLNRRPVGTPVFVTHDGQEDVSDLEAIGAVFRRYGPGEAGEPALVATHSSLRAFRNTAESTAAMNATLQMHSKQQNSRNHQRQLGAEHALSAPTKRENSVQSVKYGAITNRKASQQQQKQQQQKQQQQPRTSNYPRPKKTRGTSSPATSTAPTTAPTAPTATPSSAPTYQTSPTSTDDFVDMLIAMHGDFFVFNPLSTFRYVFAGLPVAIVGLA